MITAAWFLLVLAVLVVALTALWIYATAHRLDRLHVRLDAAWLALDAALSRRAVVARAMAGAEPSLDRRLVTLGAAAERTGRLRREAAENALSAVLEDVPIEWLSPQLAGELADARTRVLLARRFHNDAVRDTLALRSSRLVRWLRLGGTAPQPRYFEIAEGRGAGGLNTEPAGPPRRPAARVVLLDSQNRVLLLRGADAGQPETFYWITTGGGVEQGENTAAAAVRELKEETGLRVDMGVLRGPLWWRRAVFDFDGRTIEAEETYFTAAVADFEPRRDGLTELEMRTITGAKWCTVADLAELERSGERVYPPGLGALLPEAVDVARAAPGAQHATPRRIA